MTVAPPGQRGRRRLPGWKCHLGMKLIVVREGVDGATFVMFVVLLFMRALAI